MIISLPVCLLAVLPRNLNQLRDSPCTTGLHLCILFVRSQAKPVVITIYAVSVISAAKINCAGSVLREDAVKDVTFFASTLLRGCHRRYLCC